MTQEREQNDTNMLRVFSPTVSSMSPNADGVISLSFDGENFRPNPNFGTSNQLRIPGVYVRNNSFRFPGTGQFSRNFTESDKLRKLEERSRNNTAKKTVPRSVANTYVQDLRWDIFISYRRSNGSVLADFLSLYLSQKSYTVFRDYPKLGFGEFPQQLLQAIRQTRVFLLLLTSNALDGCINDPDCKDYVHWEIVNAKQSQCSIIPVMTLDFEMPLEDDLPEDIRFIPIINAVKYASEWQRDCLDKLDSFIRQAISKNDSTGPSSSHAHQSNNLYPLI